MKFLCTIIFVVLAFIGGCIFDGLITRVPQDALTSGRLMRLKKNIERYYAVKKSIPESLNIIAATLGDISTNNAWGGPIFYSVSNETSVILKTYGPGGPDAKVRQEFTLQFDVLEGRSSDSAIQTEGSHNDVP